MVLRKIFQNPFRLYFLDLKRYERLGMEMNKKPVTKKGFIRIWNAFIYSLNGLRIAITQETSFKQEIGIYIVLLFVLFFLPLSFVFKCLLFFANTMVLIVEIINSAIESIVDMASPEYHDLAGKGKDYPGNSSDFPRFPGRATDRI